MNLDWRKGILYATTIGIEGCWLYALMVLLNKQVADERLSIFGILLLYPLSAGLNSLLRRLRWPEIFLRSLSWVVWVAGMLLTVKIQLFGGLAWSDTAWLLALPRAIAELIYLFKPELLILISTAVCWWLGRRLAYVKTGFTTLVSEFQFGLFILVITFLIANQLEVDIVHTVYLIVSFFLLSLLGISIAHALEGTSWLSGINQGHWSGLLLISISLVLILGFLISAVVTPDLLQLFWSALKWVWGLIVKAMLFLASLLPESEPAELPPMAMPTPEMETTEGFRWGLPEALRNGLRIAWTVLFIGAILFALWRISSDIFRWLRRRLASMAGAEFEPLPGAFRADFLGFLKHILSKLLGLRTFFRPRAEPVQPEITPGRQIYRQFLRWAANSGFPRQVSQTPHEYLYELASLLPEAQGDLDLITLEYVRTRYGAGLLTEDELHQMRQSWSNLKQHRLGGRR